MSHRFDRVDPTKAWWTLRREALLSLSKHTPLYVYNDETINEMFFDLLSMDVLDGLYYPYPLNPCPEILQKAFELDVQFRCHAWAEITHLRSMFPRITPGRICLLSCSDQQRDCKTALDGGIQIAVKIPDSSAHFLDTSGEKAIFKVTDWASVRSNASLSAGSVTGLYIRFETGAFRCGHMDETQAFFKGVSRAYPELSKVILGHPAERQDLTDGQIADMPQLERFLEVIQGDLPQVRLWIELPASWLAYAGGLLVKVVQGGEALNPNRLRIDAGMGPHRFKFDPDAPDVARAVNLSRQDENDLMIRCSPHGDWQAKGGSVEKGDILFLPRMGVYGPGEERTDTGRNGVKEHYLRARSMCPVKL